MRNRLKPRQRVYVTLDTQRTVEGVLMRTGRRWTVLQDARVEKDDGNLEATHRPAWVPSARIVLIQTATP